MFIESGLQKLHKKKFYYVLKNLIFKLQTNLIFKLIISSIYNIVDPNDVGCEAPERTILRVTNINNFLQ